MGKRVTNVDKK